MTIQIISSKFFCIEYIVITIIMLLWAAYRHGKQSNYNFWTDFIATLIITGGLYYSGMFNALFK